VIACELEKSTKTNKMWYLIIYKETKSKKKNNLKFLRLLVSYINLGFRLFNFLTVFVLSKTRPKPFKRIHVTLLVLGSTANVLSTGLNCIKHLNMLGKILNLQRAADVAIQRWSSHLQCDTWEVANCQQGKILVSYPPILHKT
jgi:hypothetical protein